MADSINWCDLKKNAKHIGEVSTSRVDGSPTGAEILTSTNEVTGQVRDTLAGKFKKMDDAFSGIASSQFIVTNFGNWSTVAGQQIVVGDELKGYEYPDDSGEVYAVKGSVALPITRPVSPIGDNRFYLASAVNIEKMRSEAASQLGLVYSGEWSSGIVIPANAMTNKLAYWHEGQFYSVGTDTGFTSTNFDADLSAGLFLNSSITQSKTIEVFDCVEDSKNNVKEGIKTTKSYYLDGNFGGAQYELTTLARAKLIKDNPAWIPDGYKDHYCVNNDFVLLLLHEQKLHIEQCGFIPENNSNETRTLNDTIFDKLKTLTDFSTFVFDSAVYYKHLGMHMTADQCKGIVGNTTLESSMTTILFDQVTERVTFGATKSGLETNASLLPVEALTDKNTYLCWGDASTDALSVQFKNFRVRNDNPSVTKDKNARTGLGWFYRGNGLVFNNVATDGCHIGSIDWMYNTVTGKAVHFRCNIGFIKPKGTSQELEGCYVHGSNYNDALDDGTYDVTYTSDEDNQFFGFGYLFGDLYYSGCKAPAVDKIQNGYAVIGNDNSYRTSYIFTGAGAERVSTRFYVDHPNAFFRTTGGQDWGRDYVLNCKQVVATDGWFLTNTSPNLSAGKVQVDGVTFDTHRPDFISGEYSVDTPMGYGGLSYNRVGVSPAGYEWRIFGRIITSQLQFKIANNVNGNVNGTIKSRPINLVDETERNSVFGDVLFASSFYQSTYIDNMSVTGTMSELTRTTEPGFAVYSSPLVSTGNIEIEFDLHIRTGFSADFSLKNKRPPFIRIKSVDY